MLRIFLKIVLGIRCQTQDLRLLKSIFAAGWLNVENSGQIIINTYQYIHTIYKSTITMYTIMHN